jgi:multicomponent Na+:H+ antiporter subunit B
VKSIILTTTTRLLTPMILLFSAFLLLRGHQLPGGGFIGGLIAAAAFGLYLLAFDARQTRGLLRIDPRNLVSLGLIVALGSGLVGMAENTPFLTSRWGSLQVADLGQIELGSPLFFDFGVYLVVLGSALTMLITLMEEG